MSGVGCDLRRATGRLPAPGRHALVGGTIAGLATLSRLGGGSCMGNRAERGVGSSSSLASSMVVLVEALE